MKKAPTSKSYALRIDGPLVKPLQELKKRNRRSLNAEINAALDAWIAISRGQSTTVEHEPIASQPVDGALDAPEPKPRRSKKQVKQPLKRSRAGAEATPESESAGSPALDEVIPEATGASAPDLADA